MLSSDKTTSSSIPKGVIFCKNSIFTHRICCFMFLFCFF